MEQKHIWALTKQEICGKFGTHPNFGLKESEVKEKRDIYGLNELSIQKRPIFKTYIAPLFNWLIVMYLISALITLVAGFFVDDTNWGLIYLSFGMVALNFIVAIYQQARATKKLDALKSLSTPRVRVIRDGQLSEIVAKFIVPGDLLDLKTGDFIPADARIILSSNLLVNESSLTGESEPVNKNSGGSLSNKMFHIQNLENIVFSGTFISTGYCKAIVYATGESTEIGKISKGMATILPTEIPIKAKMDNIGKKFAIGITLLWLTTVVTLYFTTGDVKFIESLNAAMNIMPTNIPILVTIILITGVVGMADHGVIVRNIASIDSLGRVSVVLSDKTGTLTKSQMSVQHIWTRGSTFNVTGAGFNPEGRIYLVDNPQNPQLVENVKDFPHLNLLLTSGYINNNAVLMKSQFEIKKKRKKSIVSDWKVVGSATEGALLSLAKKSGVNQIGDHDLIDDYEDIYEYPFSSDSKRMTKIFKHLPSGKIFAYTKGTSEYLITNCEYLLAENNTAVEFVDELRLVMMNTVNTYAMRGFRILSFAYRPLEAIPSLLKEKRGEIEDKLIYIGFVAILDPPREGVKEAINLCRQAGIDVVMITGDSAPTARSISKQVSIIQTKDDLVVDASKFTEKMEEIEIDKIKVFSRAIPKHKQMIVEKYQSNKKIVAMTGDGVNDALALNLADIGIAMGIQGTDVAKDASDMIISDDSFNSIVEGIRQGRGIFSNIRSIVFFFICVNMFEGLVNLFISVVLARPFLLEPEFLNLWVIISLAVHSLPGFMLTFDKVPQEIMKESPRNSQEIISKEFVILLASYGIFLISTLLGLYFLSSDPTYLLFSGNYPPPSLNQLWAGIDLKLAKSLTMMLVTISFAEYFLSLQIRRPNKSLLEAIKEDTSVTVVVIFILLYGTIISLMYIPQVQFMLLNIGLYFRVLPLTILDWLICLSFAIFGCILPLEGIKRLLKKKGIIF
jgi:P-type Ca2+ transporter type 2C